MTLIRILAGLYIHIPFCKQACYYCDFHFSTSQKNRLQLCEALVQELALQKAYLANETIHTLYFGGGTPSILKEEELTMILDAVHKHYHVAPSIECTLEANPDDLDESVLTMLHRIGVNRLSIGIQSFDDKILKSLNRAHTQAQAIDCVRLARAIGFNNISCDLIYAIPGLTNQDWEQAIHNMIALHPEHISAYALTIEAKTVFGNWQKKGKFDAMPDDHAAHQLEILVSTLASHGYEQYEVSNFAKKGFTAVHNTNYWRQEKYLGIGPSAHSFNKDSRQYNVSNNTGYSKAIESGVIPFTLETLSREDKINDYILTTLRTQWGVNLQWLNFELQYDLRKENSKYIEQLIESTLAIINDHHLILTKKGMMLADKIASDLFVIAS